MSFTAEQVVESFYRAVLNRAPDEEGMKAHAGRLRSDPSSIMSLATDLFHSEEHRNVLGGPSVIEDHSQFGEFRMLLRHLVETGTKNRIIVDVGARGKDRSNSFDLMTLFGWKGVLIEANPALYDQITNDFEGTDFTLVKCAVGPSEGKLPFFIGTNNDVSSLLEGAARSWGELRGQVDVEVKRLPNLLRDLRIPPDFDVLSLDIEGVDVPVLNDLVDQSGYRPTYIIIEASNSFQTKTLADVGCSSRVQTVYEIIGQTEANLILRKK